MAQCKSCFTVIDGRSVATCSECNSPLHKDCVINFGGVVFCDVCFTVGKEKPKQKYGEFALPEFIRRTHIETYRSCAYKFYQEVILGNEMPPNEYTQVGSDLHELFERAIKEPHYPIHAMKEDFKQLFDAYESSLYTFKTPEQMWQRAIDSIDAFYTVLPTLGNIHTVEETIFTHIGDNIPKVRITMDLITDDGELHMHDWKTGAVMVGKKLSSDLQAPLYIYSVREHFKRDVASFTFYYLQENKTRTFYRNPINPDEYICTVGKRDYKISLTDSIREVKSIFSRIKKGAFDPVQNGQDKYFTQKMCHLKAIGKCCQDADPWSTV